jgi:hypothetical protein
MMNDVLLLEVEVALFESLQLCLYYTLHVYGIGIAFGRY